MAQSPRGSGRLDGILGVVEWLGNKLPDPIFLFIGATVLIFGLSLVGSQLGWQVQPRMPRIAMETVVENGVEVTRAKEGPDGRPVVELVDMGGSIRPRNLVSSDGVYWLIANLVRNFINFAPLGVVLVSMFGIGIAEKAGLFAAFMKFVASIVPMKLLTPTVVFLGIVSNTASDAGYIILPPLAAALYMAVGRPPLAGIAAAFAGVSGGFSANLLIASTDTLIAPLTQIGARILEPNYVVNPACNWWFLAASTVLITFVGWGVTAWVVEPRLAAAKSEPAPAMAEAPAERSKERAGLRAALIAAVLTVGGMVAVLSIPGAPLEGDMPAPAPRLGPIPSELARADGKFVAADPASPAEGKATLRPGLSFQVENEAGERGTVSTRSPMEVEGRFAPGPKAEARWSVAIVPLILVGFLAPGLAYGFVTGTFKRLKDVSAAFIGSMQTMAPIIAMAFFAAQFIESFRHSQLDGMLAHAGGQALFAAGLPKPLMLVGVILLVMVVNILMSSMSAKWTALSVILVPMLMMAGISPELTQAAYRVGDSVTNIVTPLNTYVIVILAAAQRFKKDMGVGNLIAMMLPYTVIFFVFWTVFLLIWVAMGWQLGPMGPLTYSPNL